MGEPLSASKWEPHQEMTPRFPFAGASPPADHRVERPRVEGGQPSERSGAHGRGRSHTSAHSDGGGGRGPRRPGSVTPMPPPRSFLPFSPAAVCECGATRRSVAAGWRACASAAVSHPVPSRTRSCPPPAPAKYWGGNSPGKAARARGTPPPPTRGAPRSHRNPSCALSLVPDPRRGVEQRQLVGLITQRSWVRIPPPLPVFLSEKASHRGVFFRCQCFRTLPPTSNIAKTA